MTYSISIDQFGTDYSTEPFTTYCIKCPLMKIDYIWAIKHPCIELRTRTCPEQDSTDLGINLGNTEKINE